MTLIYTVEISDLVAFNQYYMAHSGVIKARRHKTVGFMFTVFCGLGGLISIQERSVVPLLICTGIACAWSAWFLMRSGKLSVKQIARLYDPQKDKGTLCRHELEVGEDGLIHRTPVSASRMRFQGITEVVRTNGHAFIFVGSMSGHVIPRSRIIEGDFEAFMQALSERWETAQSDVGDAQAFSL
ncbi:MAG TPA: YcxB family protein [Phycisphaerales bacterium]|nr:YcxB family protein [Phycisphaerales bacterium]